MIKKAICDNTNQPESDLELKMILAVRGAIKEKNINALNIKCFRILYPKLKENFSFNEHAYLMNDQN